MKTHLIELQRLKAANQRQGAIELQVDATVSVAPPQDDGMPTSTLRLSEETARVLVSLLKTQLLELDKRKAKSRR